LSGPRHGDEQRPQRLSLLLPTDVFNETMEEFRAGGAPMVEVDERCIGEIPVHSRVFLFLLQR
jgi:hypothetical protein